MTNSADVHHDVDDDQILQKLRQDRLAQLKREAALGSETYGCLSPISHEKEVVHIIANTGRLVIHFRMASFRRCAIMSDHLEMLAKMYGKTRFIEVNADEMPFLVAKFKIQMLPCLAVVIFGQLVDRIVGFDELGGSDDFQTSILEQRLQLSTVIPPATKHSSSRLNDSDDEY